MNKRGYTISKQVEKWLEFRPEACSDVLQFIDDFVGYSKNTEVESEAVRKLFRAGYCYYFAGILKKAFNRGEVCLAAPYGHFVWLDPVGDIPYDVEGVYEGEADYFIPEKFLGNTVEDFMHVPGVAHDTKEHEIEEIIRRFVSSKYSNTNGSTKDIKNYAGDYYGKEMTRQEMYDKFPGKDLIYKTDEDINWDRAILYGVTEPGDGNKLLLRFTEEEIFGLCLTPHDCRYSALGDDYDGWFVGVTL